MGTTGGYGLANRIINVSFMAKNERGQNILMPYEEQRVLYRSDTHAPLSVVSQRYQEVQPKEILEFYRDLTEQSGFELETQVYLKVDVSSGHWLGPDNRQH